MQSIWILDHFGPVHRGVKWQSAVGQERSPRQPWGLCFQRFGLAANCAESLSTITQALHLEARHLQTSDISLTFHPLLRLRPPSSVRRIRSHPSARGVQADPPVRLNSRATSDSESQPSDSEPSRNASLRRGTSCSVPASQNYLSRHPGSEVKLQRKTRLGQLDAEYKV